MAHAHNAHIPRLSELRFSRRCDTDLPEVRHDDGENAKNIHFTAGERFITKNFAALCSTLQYFVLSRFAQKGCSIFAVSKTIND